MNSLTATFYQLLADNLPQNKDKQAIVDPFDDVTYGSLSRQVDNLSYCLKRLGVERGDRVIVRLRKSIAEVIAMFAIAKVGGVIVNVNSQWTIDQLRYVANDSGAKTLITDQRTAKVLANEPLPATLVNVLVSGNAPESSGFHSWDESVVATQPISAEPVLDTDLAMIIYTSGSTGQPKGVMLSHRNIVAGARSVARYLELSHDDRLLSVLAYNFDAGLNQLTTMMLAGGTIVHQPVVMASEIIATIASKKVTGFAGVPPLISQVVRVLSERPTAMPTLRRVTNTGGRIPLNILKQMPIVFPDAKIYLMYGLTEAFRSTYLRPEKFATKMGAIGQAVPQVEVFIVKAEGGIAGPGEQGELVHRGPLVSMGYWGKPAETHDKIRPCPDLSDLIGNEPVVYSGDIVQIDEDGDLWFIGRTDTLIKISGFRLSPDEVEDQVARSGLVSDVVAYGVDHEELGQQVAIAVAPLEGFSIEALTKHCRRSMPSYMVPTQINVWTESMPRLSSGKLDRPAIVKRSHAPSEDDDAMPVPS